MPDLLGRESDIEWEYGITFLYFCLSGMITNEIKAPYILCSFLFTHAIFFFDAMT
jgi:hypothetical protein